MLSAEAYPGNPYDDHTLKANLSSAIANTGVVPTYGFVDLGYRGHDEGRVMIYHSRQKRGVTKSLKKWIKRRSAIEPVIGHMKQSHDLSRCCLKGKVGDQINALLAGIGYNLSLIFNRLAQPG